MQVRGKPRDPLGDYTAVPSSATEMSAVPGGYGSFSRGGGGGGGAGGSSSGKSPRSRAAPATELVTSLGPAPVESPRFGAQALRNRSMLNNSVMRPMIDVEVLPPAVRPGDEYPGCARPRQTHTHTRVCCQTETYGAAVLVGEAPAQVARVRVRAKVRVRVRAKGWVRIALTPTQGRVVKGPEDRIHRASAATNRLEPPSPADSFGWAGV